MEEFDLRLDNHYQNNEFLKPEGNITRSVLGMYIKRIKTDSNVKMKRCDRSMKKN